MKRSERVLLGLFAVLFVVIVGGGGLSFAWNHYQSVREETERLRNRLVEMNLAVTQGAEWQRRSDWLEANVPFFISRQQASARLLEAIQKEAEHAGLAIASREFLENTEGQMSENSSTEEDRGHGYFDRATVRVTLNAAQEKALFSWMHALQQPQRFLGITRLLLNPSGKGKTVNAEVEITQFYRESAAATVTPVAEKGGDS